MRSRRVLCALFAVTALLPSVLVHADGVSEQQKKVQQIVDQLDQIDNQIGQLDDEYGAAQDKKDLLDADIAASQVAIGQQQARLGELQGTLAAVAVHDVVAGGSSDLSPLFSSASAYSDAQQRSQLSLLAIDSGAGDTDEMQSLIATLAKEQAALAAKQQQATTLIRDALVKLKPNLVVQI